MNEWWEGLDLLSKTLYCIAIPCSLLLIIQTVLILIGFGSGGEGLDLSDTSGLDLDVPSHADLHTDIDPNIGDGSIPADFGTMQLFTLQGIIVFFTMFSWTSIIAYHAGTNGFISLLLGFVVGAAAMVGVAKLIQMSRKLISSGNINIKNALGESARVYLTIPAGGRGKVSLTVQERLIEADAMSDDKNDLVTGTMVRVVDIRSGILVVEKD